ncbi:MAG: hypothetical protein ACYTGG_05060 [Planctomycetota bacterium]|jgi:probable HAF family extracellular repeat protein
MNTARRPLLRHLSLLVAATCIAAFVNPGGLATQPQYTLVLIDLFDDDFSNYGIAINAAGQVAGYSGSPAGRHAWRWTNGMLEDIGSTGGTVMEARDIDENGRVVGFGNDADLLWVGWTWDGRDLTLIPTLGGDGSRAWSTNELGEVVGDAQIPTNVWNAFVWTSGDPVNLGTLGGANSQAYAVNSTSQIAGFAVTPAIEARAVIWESSGITELEHPAEYPDSVAYGINDAGVAVGTVGSPPFVIIPAMWDDDGLHMLPQLGDPDTKAYAWSVNMSGQVVGWSELSFANVRATTWLAGEVHDLNDLVDTAIDITLTQAWDINDDGVIVGTGLMETGPRAFLLLPQGLIPEDVNGDGVVNHLDVRAVVRAFGPCEGCPEDVNGDGVVDLIDLFLVLQAWHGQSNPSPPWLSSR